MASICKKRVKIIEMHLFFYHDVRSANKTALSDKMFIPHFKW